MAQTVERAKPENVHAAICRRLDREGTEAANRAITRVQPATLPLYGLDEDGQTRIRGKIEQAISRSEALDARTSLITAWSLMAGTLFSFVVMTVGIFTYAGRYFFVVVAASIIWGLLFAFASLMAKLLPAQITKRAEKAAFYVPVCCLNIFLLLYWIKSSVIESWLFGVHGGSSVLDAQGITTGLLYLTYSIDGLAIVAALATWNEFRLTRKFQKADPATGPYDRAIASWAWTIRWLELAAPDWPTQALMKQSVMQLESLAVVVRGELKMTWLRDTNYLMLPHFHLEAYRVYAAILRHRSRLVRCGTGEGFQQLLESLSDGLVALTLGNRDRLLANAPEITRSTMVKDAFKRAYPGLILLAAGIALPYIPQIAKQPEVADNVRVALIVMGVLALASAPSDAAQKVNDIVAKILPFGKI
ncbi:hypothetical protein [Streptomyces sp. NPDC058457]|uniref:hypothetical protein n=1 Tax=Streptomyces sp. NPDC058457 TaxID=3346507 RepID=UPI003664E6F5